MPTKESLSSSLSGLPNTDPSSKKKSDKGSKGSSKKVRAVPAMITKETNYFSNNGEKDIATTKKAIIFSCRQRRQQ